MQQNKKYNIWQPLQFAIVMVIGIFMGYKMRDGNPGLKFFSLERSNPINEILTLIKSKYVDSVNLNKLTDTAITSILSDLDPHSIYISPSEIESVNEELEGNFYGIGIEYNVFNDTLNVINVLKDGPSFRAGLITGDKIVSADGQDITGKNSNTDTIRKLLRGKIGTNVTIGLVRDHRLSKIKITRGIIPLSSIDASFMVDSTTGYIRLNKFSQQTHREFALALEDLKNSHNLKNLIFDLRENGGGVLEEATDVADELLSGDKLITYTIGSHMPKKEYRCKFPGLFEDGNLVVLCDQGTASASEIVIGALKDWKRATLIGQRTFGKGLVQDQFSLSNGGALRLTVARYFTPLGKSIQRSYAKGTKAYYDEISERFAAQLPGHDSLHFAPVSAKDSGGIAPDYYVSVFDTIPGYISARIFSRGTLNAFAYYYYLNSRLSLSQYKTTNQFILSFEIGPKEWDEFEERAKRDSIDLSKITSAEKTFLMRRMKTAIARQMWRDQGYYETISKDDPAIQAAIQYLKSK